MNFANLAGIYDKELMNRPIPKTLDISVCEMTIKGMILSKDLLKHKINTVFRKLCCSPTAISLASSRNSLLQFSRSPLGTPGT